jgi:soluble lytic murein transglycosylase
LKLDRDITVFLFLGVVCLISAINIPPLQAERAGINFGVKTVPMRSDDLHRVTTKLRLPGVHSQAKSSVHISIAAALARVLRQYDRQAYQAAHESFRRGDLSSARLLLEGLLEQLVSNEEDWGDETNERLTRLEQTRIFLAHVLLKQAEPKKALELLEKPGTPIDDYLHWLRAEAHESMGSFAEAVTEFTQILELAPSALHPRALVRRAHALFRVGDWKEAAAAHRKVRSLYPDYPRRAISLFELGRSLEALEKPEKAMEAYQTLCFEFPYKSVAMEAEKRIEVLNSQGAKPVLQHSFSKRLDRYQDLRINKHWTIAERLLVQLSADAGTDAEHTGLQNRILYERARLELGRRNFATSAGHFELLVRRAKNRDKHAGIQLDLVRKYLSRAYRGMGDHERALKTRAARHPNQRARALDRAEYLRSHGLYREAHAIFETHYTMREKSGWEFSWSLYKNGHFEQAIKNLEQLAKKSSGRRRSKYLYWLARAHHHAKNTEDAKGFYYEILDKHKRTYYAIQAQSRLWDLEQGAGGGVQATTAVLTASGDEAVDAFDQVLEELDRKRDAFDLEERTSQRGAEPALVEHDDRDAPTQMTSNENTPPDAANIGGNLEDAPKCRMPADYRGSRSRACMENDYSIYSSWARTGEFGGPLIVTPTDVKTIATGLAYTIRQKSEGLTKRKRARKKGRSKPFEFERDPLIGPEWTMSGRIHWDGPLRSGSGFVRAKNGEVMGPMPSQIRAYDEETYLDGLRRGSKYAGDLFPELTRAHWLRSVGLFSPARWAARDVAIEFLGIKNRVMPRRGPIELKTRRWNYYIDNRRSNRRGFWGTTNEELRFPVPTKGTARKAFVERQRLIHSQRHLLEPIVVDALKNAGDHFMVREFTLSRPGWYRRNPHGDARAKWMQAYPRAFPQLVYERAMENGLNPYLLWAIMTVESSYNPDSISPARAMGLLQVIPKTGLKTAMLLGDEQFGPHDLLDEKTAILHGAYYYGRLVHKFRGQELLAIAGYNGGPHRVGDWLDMRGHIPLDEFVEEIPYNEAREYTKKVTRFLALYLDLYERRTDLYIGQKLRSNYREHPNF